MTFDATTFAPITTSIESVIGYVLPLALGIVATIVGLNFGKKVLHKFGIGTK